MDRNHYFSIVTASSHYNARLFLCKSGRPDDDVQQFYSASVSNLSLLVIKL